MKKKVENGYGKKIVVDSQNKTLSLYDKGCLTKVFYEACLGKNGVTSSKNEGDMCTPKGVFPLGFAFGTRDLDVDYPYFVLSEDVYWVSDAHSRFYNEWVLVSNEEMHFPYPYMHTSKEITWDDAEHLIQYPVEYELAIVILYNYPVEKGLGSAIFLHVKNKEYTAGCVSTTLQNMEYILHWLGNCRAVIEIK